MAGTPSYCYSSDTIRENFDRYRRNFPADRAMVCYAVKANSNQSVLRMLGEQGAGADVVSGGELKRALLAGIPAQRIVFSGVAKTGAELAYALEQGIFQFNVESEPELEHLNEAAVAQAKKAPVAFRVNPDIDAGTHEKITTGKAVNKFGIPRDRAADVYRRAASLPGIEVQGIAMHIGSQLTDLGPFRAAFACLAELARALRDDGHGISVLDIGGGLGIDYKDGAARPPGLEDYARAAREALDPLGCRIVVEPGRSIVGEAGVLVTEVVYVKEGEGVRFAIVDAGMNDLMRPSLYGAYHEVSAVVETDRPLARYDVVGPICETGDTFVRGVDLPELEPGDLLVFRNAGAYGAVMSGTYNTRALAPEILIRDGAPKLIRRRVEPEELIALDL